MTKVSKLLYRNISKLKNTSKEFVDFILYISRIQDSFGRCLGLHYKDTSQAAGICFKTFYNNLKQAEKLGIIKMHWDKMTTKQNDWDFEFIEDTSAVGSDFNRYLNVNLDFLYTDVFRELRLNEKLLVLHILGLKGLKDGKYRKLSFDTLLKYAGISDLPLLMEYLESLRSFFDIQIKDNYVIIHLPYENTKSLYTANDIHTRYYFKTFCRRNKIAFTLKDLNKMVIVFNKFKDKYYNIMLEAIQKACSKYGILDPVYIEYKIKDAINLSKV